MARARKQASAGDLILLYLEVKQPFGQWKTGDFIRDKRDMEAVINSAHRSSVVGWCKEPEPYGDANRLYGVMLHPVLH
jgi:hypothetical protein